MSSNLSVHDGDRKLVDRPFIMAKNLGWDRPTSSARSSGLWTYPSTTALQINLTFTPKNVQLFDAVRLQPLGKNLIESQLGHEK
ncbi:hypothetical protein E4U57_007968 [Claviceps arundinis]|uniref:Uncharacterized protein n=1 Tax=Claviceps arundinis TaxID=1623583 RepID=A0ABQ7PLY8_9HYPO|nr:hypothetical protein E4U57_007968 [Claviceps arundinis]